mgnify:CR=1 FL=1
MHERKRELAGQLVERSGNGLNGVGSITAFYTVLAEGDDQQDPVVDTARAVLDGHIVLTRALAERGHYPAIDVGQSISRCMNGIISQEHMLAARALKAAMAKHDRVRDLIPLGAYVPGADPVTDRAVQLNPHIEHFLCQGTKEDVDGRISQIRAAIEEVVDAKGLSGPAAMGPIMKEVLARFGSSADGATINRIAREVLAKKA